MREKKQPNRKLWLSVWCVVLALVIAFNVWVTNYALSWDKVLTGYFGTLSGGQTSNKTAEPAADSEKFTDLDALAAAEKEAELEIVSEGMVLLRNDNHALPLAKGSKVSVFGISAQMWMTKEKVNGTKDVVFLESLQNAGLEINKNLRKFYKQSKHTKWGTGANLGNGGIAGDWTVDEVPQNEYTDDLKASYAEYGDAAIVVFSRGGSEGGDLPRHMGRFGGSDDQGYLQLTENEEDLLASVGENFDKVIVVLHTTNAMQMDFAQVEKYGIDAIVWVSGTGADGVEAVGGLFTGDINPSGRTVDTFVYDNCSAPAMQNFGDFRFTQNGELVKAVTTTVGGTYSYMNYAENIYVGYKYYETRYEDAVLSAANVGDYDYAATVAYPFGYGLSYTDFTWSDFTSTQPDMDGNMTLSVTVTNSGSMAGKDVVELYYQSPYTDYDRENGVEKAAVNLLEFGKTALLQPGEKETITLTVNIHDMASYDSQQAKTYLLETGDYYVTLAHDAHDAVNSILAAKGITVDGGDAARVAKHTVTSQVIGSKSASGGKITNLFDDARLADAVYLSRSNWASMDNMGLRYAEGTMTGQSQTMDEAGTVYTHEATDAIIAALSSEGWEVAGNPVSMDDASWKAQTYGAAGTLTLSDMTGKSWDDPDWDKLLNQMTQAEQTELVGRAMNTTSAVASIDKSVTYYMDGPQGMIDYVSGGAGYQFTDENLLGATWNKELVWKMADLCTQEFALKGATTWWSPAVNIHRTAYSGRNFEYYSEDGVFNGIMGTVAAVAAKANGVNCQVKHFFLNDQEANRGAHGRLAPFATEQALREIYAKAFQMPIEAVPSSGVMLSMARIGTTITPGSWAVCTGLLRNEWGMTGAIITDAQSLTPAEAEQSLAAGCDMVDTAQQTIYPDSILNSAAGQTTLRNAVKHLLYMEANSAAVEIENVTGYPIYKLILIAYNVLTFIYMAWFTLEILRKLFPEKKFLSDKAMKIIRVVLGTIGIIGIGILLFLFFTQWLPMLQFALQTAV